MFLDLLIHSFEPLIAPFRIAEQLLQTAFQEGANLVTSQILEGKSAQRVVAARQNGNVVVPVLLPRALYNLPRQMDGEGRVVFSVDKLGALLLFGEEIPIARRTDARPQLSQRWQIDCSLQTLADMPRRKAFPHHIGDIGRAMVENVHANASVVSAGQKCITGTKAGTHDPEVREPLLLQPVKARAAIDDRLASGVDRAADVG